MKRVRSLLLAMAATGALSAAAMPGADAAAASTQGTLRTADGRERTYHLYVPPNLVPGASVPLLVALHGGTGWGTQFEQNSGFDQLADRHGFIVVYPDGVGVGRSGTALRTWNGGDCCGPAARQQVDDVGFVRLLVEQLQQEHSIDPARVFAAGHSNGGILAYRLACEASDVFAAVGVQSSSLEMGNCQPSQPVSAIHIHGTDDRNVPLRGGTGPNAISGVSFRRPISGARTLAIADGCHTKPTTGRDPTNHDVTITRWMSCHDDTEVRFVTVKGASHAWMGHPTLVPRLVGEPYEKLDSSAVIWQFLSAHPRG
jgi:polyhydroxybutyrate depolymerase